MFTAKEIKAIKDFAKSINVKVLMPDTKKKTNGFAGYESSSTYIKVGLNYKNEDAVWMVQTCGNCGDGHYKDITNLFRSDKYES